MYHLFDGLVGLLIGVLFILWVVMDALRRSDKATSFWKIAKKYYREHIPLLIIMTILSGMGATTMFDNDNIGMFIILIIAISIERIICIIRIKRREKGKNARESDKEDAVYIEENIVEEDDMNSESKEKHTLDYDEITRILEEALRNEDIEAFYARTSNKLKIVAECYDGNDDGEYDFLNELISHLKGIIVHKFMKEHGWIQDDQDEFKRWKREE